MLKHKEGFIFLKATKYLRKPDSSRDSNNYHRRVWEKEKGVAVERRRLSQVLLLQFEKLAAGESKPIQQDNPTL